MTTKRILMLAFVTITLPIVVGQVPPEGSNCQNDHWDPLCNGGVPVLQGSTYYACATGNHQNGVYWCCSYIVGNYSCENPPPSQAKFFDFTSASHTGPCIQESWGQHCPEEG